MTRAQRRYAVASQLVDVGRSLNAFNSGNEQYLSRAVSEAMKEAERAFVAEDYARAERLVKVITYLVKREAPRFAANPKAWIETRRELRI